MPSLRPPSVEDIWYGDSPAARALRAALAPASALFGAGVAARNALYASGLLRAGRAPARVVSVGGLRVGGAGKTPFVLWLARRLCEEGMRPCIVTRGYGGSGGENAFVLRATDASTNTIVDRAGDEAVLLAIRSGCPVAVGHDRLAACRTAWKKLIENGEPPDVFVLDDGFQHRALARDVDIVMTSGADASMRLLPAGPLREPVSALRRAAVAIALTTPDAPAAASADGATHFIRAAMRPSMLVSSVADVSGHSPSWLSGRDVVAVAAIARPERFLDDLSRAGARIVKAIVRRDHHRYDESDGVEIDRAVTASPASVVVTTEKDLVKLTHLRPRLRMLALRIELEIESRRDENTLIGLVTRK